MLLTIKKYIYTCKYVQQLDKSVLSMGICVCVSVFIRHGLFSVMFSTFTYKCWGLIKPLRAFSLANLSIQSHSLSLSSLFSICR